VVWDKLPYLCDSYRERPAPVWRRVKEKTGPDDTKICPVSLWLFHLLLTKVQEENFVRGRVMTAFETEHNFLSVETKILFSC